MTYFENQNKLVEFSKSLQAFPSQGGAYNDISGRYSLHSQQQDRLSKSRSLPYCSLDHAPSFVSNNKRVCRFVAHFTETAPHNELEPIRTRKVEISYHVEDNTIEITEPTTRNSGLQQGKILKRHQIAKSQQGRGGYSASTSMSSRPSTTNSAASSRQGPSRVEIITLEDFYSGAEISIYNRVYTIIDCDNATKAFLAEQGRPFGEPAGIPKTFLDTSSSSRMSRTGNRTRKSHKMAGFYEYDRKVLRFFGVWDSRTQFFGDELYVRLHYSLADNLMEVLPVHTRNSGRDKLAKFLKKTPITKPSGLPDFDASLISTRPAPAFQKMFGSSMIGADPSSSSSLASDYMDAAMQPSRPYHWTDLFIGMKISVASLNITIIDADEFTREFYISKNKPLDPPIIMPKPSYPKLENTIPPHNGFGSEADSLQTCKTSLQPSAPSKDGAKAQLYQGMILRYCATLDCAKIEDISRSFIIQVHLEDDTIQIREPPQRNSGHKGGIFLSRSNLERHDGTKPVTPQDIYLGAVVSILTHKFKVHDADEYTLRFMEENSKQWTNSHLPTVLEKIRFKQEVVTRLILTTPGLANRMSTCEDVEKLFARAGLDLVKQEVITLFRVLDPKKTGFIKLTTLLKYLVDTAQR